MTHKRRWATNRNWALKRLLGAKAALTNTIDPDMPPKISSRLIKLSYELHDIIEDYRKQTETFEIAHENEWNDYE